MADKALKLRDAVTGEFFELLLTNAGNGKYTMDASAPGSLVEAVDISAADYVLTVPCRALRNGGAAAGDIKCDTVAGQLGAVIHNMQPGEVAPIRATKVWKIGTSATVIEALS